MKPVIQVQIRVSRDPQKEERDERRIVSLGQPRVHAMKIDGVREAAERGRFHAAQQYGNISRFRTLDYGREVAFDRCDHAAQPVVDSSEDHDPCQAMASLKRGALRLSPLPRH
jgi:hypothetical protein